MNEPVRLALIGAGSIGRRHLATVGAATEAVLVGVADPAPDVAALAENHGAAYFADYRQLLERLRPDGVIVATPTEHHLQPALAALAAGAAVLVEKPIAASLAEAERLCAAAEQNAGRLLVGHHRRYYPLLERARTAVANDLGRLVAVHAQWTALKHDDYYRPDWRKRREAGPVLINLVHDIDCLRVVCGEIAAVTARLSNAVRGYGKEDTAAVILELADGALATVLMSDATPSPWGWEFATGENPALPPSGQNAWRLCGTEAALDFPVLTLWRHAPGERGWHYPLRPESLPVELGDAFAAQCAHFCALIRGETTARVGGRDATRTLAATLAVLEAADSGGRVVLDDGCSPCLVERRS